MLNIREYNVGQIVDALTNPQNRHETRVRYSCSDEELYLPPDWLLQQYVDSGRAREWRIKVDGWVDKEKGR